MKKIRRFFKQYFCRHLAFTFFKDYDIQEGQVISHYTVTQCTACEKLLFNRYRMSNLNRKCGIDD